MLAQEEAPPSPPIADRSRKQHILEVAQRLWARRSYHNMSLRRIADEAGVALALIDHHFGSKHQLFAQTLGPLAAACERAAILLHGLDDKRSADDRGSDVLRAVIDPAWQLSRDRQGRAVLRLWLMHRRDTVPEISVPIRQATRGLLEPAALRLGMCWPAAPKALVSPDTAIVFGAAAELFTGEAGRCGPTQERADDAASFTIDDMVAMMAAGFQAGGGINPARTA